MRRPAGARLKYVSQISASSEQHQRGCQTAETTSWIYDAQEGDQRAQCGGRR